MRRWVLLSSLLLMAAGYKVPQPAPEPLIESRRLEHPRADRDSTGQRRDVFDGPTGTLDRLHGHITTLNPGENTGPLHRHPQEEMVIIKEGTVEVNIDGRKQVAGAGSIVFFGVNENENMTNVGRTPATYLVLQWFTPLTPKS